LLRHAPTLDLVRAPHLPDPRTDSLHTRSGRESLALTRLRRAGPVLWLFLTTLGSHTYQLFSSPEYGCDRFAEVFASFWSLSQRHRPRDLFDANRKVHPQGMPMMWFVVQVVLANPNVLMLGDSSGEFAGDSLVNFCAGATVVNRAISGTTAVQWGAAGGGTSCEVGSGCCSDGGGSCQASNAFSATYGTGYTHVWIGLGGNDFLEAPGCAMSPTELETHLRAVVREVKTAATGAGLSGIQIFATGYCQAIEPVGSCSTPETGAATISQAWAVVAAAEPNVTFVDSLDKCGGSASTWSSGDYHVDNIHLNNRGYCRVWTMPAVQLLLGCGAASYDCEVVDPLYSASQHDVADSAGNGGVASSEGDTSSDEMDHGGLDGDSTGGNGSSDDGSTGTIVAVAAASALIIPGTAFAYYQYAHHAPKGAAVQGPQSV